jgi:hypothetical protein
MIYSIKCLKRRCKKMENKKVKEAVEKHGLNVQKMLKEAAATFNEVVEKYKNGTLDNSFACDQLSAFFCSRWLQEKGAKVTREEYEAPDDLADDDAVAYIEFDSVKTATFLKKDIRFAEKWRSKMFSCGYSQIETNQDHFVERYAHRYKIDVIKKVFWLSNVEK